MIQPQSVEFVSVIKLVNCYIATHFQENRRIFISEHPETDLKVAQTTARSFSENCKLRYDSAFFEPIEPIITIMKHRKYWYPVELYADHAELLLEADSVSLAGTQQKAAIQASEIALSRGVDYKPSIGISLSIETSVEKRSRFLF